jgi:hypothetical protein
MHKAPSVTYPVGPCVWYARVLWVALTVVALAGLGVAAWGQEPSAMSVAVALGLWLGRQAVLGLVPAPSELPLS